MTDNLSLRSPQKLNLCYNYKKEQITLSPQAYLPTCEIEKQPLNGVSCTDNRFYVTLEKFLINYP